MAENQSDHERVASSGAWFGALAVSLAMVWVAAKVPYFVAWLLNSSITIGVSYVMARWKRAWYAWLCLWLIVAVSLANGILKAATPLLDNPWSSANWVLSWLIGWSWYWLVRIPRLHPPKLPDVTHIIHHHVIHGPDGQAVEVGQYSTSLPGTLPVELDSAGRPAVGRQRQPLALENLAVRPGAFIGRRGELLARLKQVKGRN